MEHYYTDKPGSVSKPAYYKIQIAGKEILFKTDSSVFSKNKLDYGTELLINTICKEERQFEGKLLDIGCGYGPIGISLGLIYEKCSVLMIDINERAVGLAIENIGLNNLTGRVYAKVSDVFSGVGNELFEIIATNPPVRAGKQVIFKMYEDALTHLYKGGRFYAVIQKKQGAESTRGKLMSVFGNVTVVEKKSGFYVFKTVKE